MNLKREAGYPHLEIKLHPEPSTSETQNRYWFCNGEDKVSCFCERNESADVKN